MSTTASRKPPRRRRNPQPHPAVNRSHLYSTKRHGRVETIEVEVWRILQARELILDGNSRKALVHLDYVLDNTR